MSRLPLIALLALAVGPFAAHDADARVPDDMMKDIKKAYLKLASDLSTRHTAVVKLQRADHPDAVKIMLDLLKGDKLARRLQAQKKKIYKERFEQMEWLKDVNDKGSKFTQSEADRINNEHRETAKKVIEIDKQLHAGAYMRVAAIEGLENTKDKEALELIYKAAAKGRGPQSTGAILALSKCGSKEGAKKHLHKLINGRDEECAAAAIYTCAVLLDYDAADKMIEALGHKAWPVRAAAAHYLGRWGLLGEKRNIEVLVKAVPALVNQLQEEDGRLQTDIDDALKNITGASFGGDKAPWKAWLDANKANLTDIVANRSGKVVASKDDLPKLFNMPIRSKRILVVIENKSFTAAVSQGIAANFLAKLEDAELSVMTYNTKTTLFAPKLVKASSGLKKALPNWITQNVKSSEIYSEQNFFDAFMEAMDFGGGYKKGPDTIVYIGSGTQSQRFGRNKALQLIFHEIVTRNLVQRLRFVVVGTGSAGQWGLLAAMGDAFGSYAGKRPQRPPAKQEGGH